MQVFSWFSCSPLLMVEEVVSELQNRLFLDVLHHVLQHKRCLCLIFFFFLWAVVPRLSGEHDVPRRVLTNCGAVTRYRNKSAGAHGVCGPVWTKGIIWSISDSFKHTQADTHPAAAMCEACFASLSRPRVKVAACRLSIFSVKT